MANYVAIFIGGGLGSLTRFAVSRLTTAFGLDFPIGTLVTNFISCFLLGCIISTIEAKWVEAYWLRLALVVGFCGGFSTFSTFTNDTFELIRYEQYLPAFLNVAGSLFLCTASLLAGLFAARFFT